MLLHDSNFQRMTEGELWRTYCGFFDLSIDEFMKTQADLLMDEVELVANSLLGKKIIGDRHPKTVDEFRRFVPITTFDDYDSYLSEQREAALAFKPQGWVHSSGKGGRFKWVPYSKEFLEACSKSVISGLILASTEEKGKVNFSPDSRVLILLPPPPYASGYMVQTLAQSFSLRAIPSLKTSDMEFAERIKLGFQQALVDGAEVIVGIAGPLVNMGELMSNQARSVRLSRTMLHPKVMGRMLRGWLVSKRERRTILPKDLWASNGILTGGMDTEIYKDALAHYWGHIPLEFYGSTESGIFCKQAWNKKWLTFCPDMVFLEFAPYDERTDSDEKHYQPSTVLLNELEAGQSYEVIITQLYGMPLLRYRLRDIIKVVALKDDEAGINLPQVVFQRRVGERINIGAMADLDEKTIWRAIVNTGVKHVDWVAFKEYDHSQAYVRILLELKENRKSSDMEKLIDEQLKIVDTDYKDVESYMGLQAVRVSLLSSGTFQRYITQKRKEGVDLAHLKPPHINPPEAIIKLVQQLGENREQ